MLALALDMGGTHIGCGVVEEGCLLAHAAIDTESAANFADLLPMVTNTLRVLLREVGTTAQECTGIIGSATILHGRLLRGVHGHAGCLGGHLTTKLDGRLCLWQRGLRGSGGVGVVDATGSACMAGVCAEYVDGVERLGFRELFMHADSGDKVAREVRQRCLQVWAANAVSLIHAYDPEVLILGGGGVMQNGGPVLSFVQEYVNTHTWSSWGKTQIAASALGNEAALLGAFPLLTEEMHGAAVELR